MLTRANDRIFAIAISILTLADGVLHLSLDWVLFRGNLFGNPFAGRTPAAGGGVRGLIQSIMPLNEAFVLNFVGAVILVVLFWATRRWLGERRWLMNVVIMVYAAATFGAWLSFGRPNPQGLGYLSKTVEVVNIIVLFVYSWLIVRAGRRVPTT